MLAWLDGLEVTGPPPITGTSSNGLSIADGPNGEAVEFTVLAKPLRLGVGPPYALIAIYSIATRA